MSACVTKQLTKFYSMQDMVQDKNDVRFAIFSFSGKENDVHVADICLEQNHEIQNSKNKLPKLVFRNKKFGTGARYNGSGGNPRTRITCDYEPRLFLIKILSFGNVATYCQPSEIIFSNSSTVTIFSDTFIFFFILQG